MHRSDHSRLGTEPAPPRAGTAEVTIPVGQVSLEGTLVVPGNATGIVVFVHGSGSSRFSPRNRFVAEVLRTGGIGTLLTDLLTPQEERIDALTRQFRFNLDLLTERTVTILDWLVATDSIGERPMGLFGSSTGAAAALRAAAVRPNLVAAVVSRGGRTDLADPFLDRVRAATLLVVGSRDIPVLRLNRGSLERLGTARARRLEVIPGASHLFEESGALERVAALARDWFTQHLASTVETTLRADGPEGRPFPRDRA